MRKILVISFIFLFAHILLANKILEYEYWINFDYNNRINNLVDNPKDTLQLRAIYDLPDLKMGVHTFNVRFKDSIGNWSAVHSSYFYKPFISNPYNGNTFSSNKIEEYEYWINTNYAGRISGNVESMSEVFQLRNLYELDTLESGVHTFNVRFKDSVGNWSAVHSSYFYKPFISNPYNNDSYSSNKIYGYRWWFDKNINTMYEIKLRTPIEKFNSILNLQCPTLDTIGKHTISMQFLDSVGNWSVAISDTFMFDGYIMPKPNLYSPVNNSYVMKDSLLDWDVVPYSTKYQLQIASDTNFTSIDVDVDSTMNTTYKLDLSFGTKYFWRVRAYFNDIASEWSEIWQFTTNGKATINTTNLSKLLSKSFVSGGNIISDGGYPITSKGICYNMTGNPTTDDFITNNGTGSASFTSYISGLTPNTNYFVRSYATNEAGTAYGNELNFKTANIDIPLGSGWNLISSNYKHSEPDSMQYIWANNTDKLVITKNNAGSVYIPQFGINSIGKWDVTQGYQVYMSAADTLGITGEPVVPAETGIALKSGWNMIAYLRNSVMEAPLAFASITDNGNLVIAKNISGQVYIPSFGINSIGNLVPGQGYRVYVTNNDTLVYPDN